MLPKIETMSRVVVVFCIAAITSFTGIAQADESGWSGENCGKHQRHSFKNFGKKLGLTDTQKAQAKAIFQGNKEIVKPIIVTLRAEKKNLHSLMHADIIDEAAIRAETVKISEIQANLNVNRAKVMAQFRSILTPDQLATMKTMRDKRHKMDGAISPQS